MRAGGRAPVPSDGISTVGRLMVVLAVIVGFALGAVGAWLLARSRAQVEVARPEDALEHHREHAGGAATRFKARSAETLERTVELAKGQFEHYRDSAAQELQRRH